MPWIIGGAILGSSIYSAERAKDASDKQIAFQSESSDTAVQRRTKDLRAAGINPILAAGQAATAMPGAQPSQYASAEGAVRGFQEAKRLKQELRNMESGERLNHELANQARQAAVTSKATAFREEQQGRFFDSQRETADQLREFQADRSKWDANSARWVYESDKAQGSFDRAIGEEGRGARLLMELIRGLRR